MRALVFACIILAACIAASLQEEISVMGTPFAPCDEGPIPTSLRVEGCNSSPCNFYRGTDLIADWDFKAIAEAQTLRTRVKVTILGVTIEYPYPQPNACKSLSKGECPLSEGDEVTYDLKMPISKVYPSVTLTIEFGLIDENNKAQVCFKLDGQVTNK